MRRRRRGGRSYFAKSPPIFSLGGMLSFGFGGILGAEAADLATRYWLGISPTATGALPNGQTASATTIAAYNDVVMAAPPSLKRIAIELGVSALGFIGGGLLARAGHGMLALFGYGWGFGGIFHLGTALVDGYLIQPMFTTTSSTGQVTASPMGMQMYQHEINASAARTAAQAATPPGTVGTPPAAQPGAGVPVPNAQQPFRLPAGRPATHVPPSLATVGAPAPIHQGPGGWVMGGGHGGVPRHKGAPPPAPQPGGGACKTGCDCTPCRKKACLPVNPPAHSQPTPTPHVHNQPSPTIIGEPPPEERPAPSYQGYAHPMLAVSIGGRTDQRMRSGLRAAA